MTRYSYDGCGAVEGMQKALFVAIYRMPRAKQIGTVAALARHFLNISAAEAQILFSQALDRESAAAEADLSWSDDLNAVSHDGELLEDR